MVDSPDKGCFCLRKLLTNRVLGCTKGYRQARMIFLAKESRHERACAEDCSSKSGIAPESEAGIGATPARFDAGAEQRAKRHARLHVHGHSSRGSSWQGRRRYHGPAHGGRKRCPLPCARSSCAH